MENNTTIKILNVKEIIDDCGVEVITELFTYLNNDEVLIYGPDSPDDFQILLVPRFDYESMISWSYKIENQIITLERIGSVGS